MKGGELKMWRHRQVTPERTKPGPHPQGWSLSEMSAWLGCDPSTLTAWENGRRPVPLAIQRIVELSK